MNDPLALVKLKAGFMAVMLLFTGAFIGVVWENAKLESLTDLQTQTLVPSRVAIRQLLLFGWQADDEGAYFIMGRSAQSARFLAAYRRDIASFTATLDQASQLANTDTQRQAIADIRKAVDGPHGWYAANERAFGLKTAGAVDLAQQAYVANGPPFVRAADVYRDNVVARINASYFESTGLQTFAETLGIGLGVLSLAGGLAISTLLGRIIR